jgi:predicted TIM-barrel fold metal-dependent hydrolase
LTLEDLPLRSYRPTSRLGAARTDIERPSLPAIDAHNHLGRWLGVDGAWTAPDVDELLRLMDASNVEAIVNLDGRWGEELEANLDRYDRAHPARFATFCQLDWSRVDDIPALVGSLHRARDAGARGVKVWKDLGLHVRDADDLLVAPDDERLAPLWDAAAGLGLPITIHTGDPVAFFDPVDERNERLEELLENPDWSFADRARFPSFGDLLGSFERLVARHSRTTFIGAHVAGNAEDLAWVGRMLATYPNLHLDIAARIAELGRQPRAAAALIERFPDRVLFGTDVFPPSAQEYAIHARFLETLDEAFPYSSDEVPGQGRWTISGLGLSEPTLRAVYADNARRLIVNAT